MRNAKPTDTRTWTLIAVMLLVLTTASCGLQADDPPPVDPSVEVDAAKTRVYVDPSITPYYDGSRVYIHVVPVDLEGALIDEEIPVNVIATDGQEVVPVAEVGAIRTFSYIPAPGHDTVGFSVAVNGTPIERRGELTVVSPCHGQSRAEREYAFDLAEAYAPTLFQDTGREPRADYLAPIDFDGDWDAANNWGNLDEYTLPGTVYYALSETRTHSFLFYGFFHPRRIGTFVDNDAQSLENDLTGAMLVIRKDGSPNGTLELLETMADGQFYLYTNEDGVRRGTETLGGTFPTTDGVGPRLYLEAHTHGAVVRAPSVFGEYLGELDSDFRGSSGVVYRYTGLGEEPEHANDRDVGYELVPLLDEVWTRRHEIGALFTGSFWQTEDCEMAASFTGDEYAGGAAPWTWDDIDDEGVSAGEWFTNPAKAVGSHVTMPEPYSRRYTYNPYLGIN